MKAFKIASAKSPADYDFGDEFELPRIHCHDCNQTWGDCMVEYPAFNFDFLNKKEFNYERVVSLDGFDQIKERFVKAVGRPINLIPGASIGPLVGKTQTKKLDDFIWGSLLYPQISRKALEILAKEGIHLQTAAFLMKYRSKPLDTHVAIHTEPVSLLTEENLEELGYTHCPTCNDFNPPLPTGLPRVESTTYKIRRDLWPEGQHLVFMQETNNILASDAFMAAVKRHQLAGLTFTECGEYV